MWPDTIQDLRNYTDICIAQYRESRSFGIPDRKNNRDQSNNFWGKIRKSLASDTFYLSPYNVREIQNVIIDYVRPFYRDEKILCASVVNDLDIVNQDGKDLAACLKHVLQPRTKAGEATLLLLLLHPTTYTQNVRQRQKLVQFFIDNPDIFDFMDELLHGLALYEDRFVTAINYDFIPKESESLYWSKIPMYGAYTRKTPFLYMANQLGLFGVLGSVSLALKFLPALFYSTTNNISHTVLCTAISWLSSLFVDVALCSSTIHVACKSRQIHHQLIGVSTYLNTIDSLVKMSERIPFFQDQPLFFQLHETVLLQKHLNDVRHFLNEYTFSGAASVMHNWGNVFVAYQKLKNISHDVFSNLFHVIGELDIAITLAKLMREDAKNDRHRWCFAQFKEDAAEPMLILKDAWNPILLHHKALDQIISNDMSFTNGMRNVILTGPNSCGKTAITTGFATEIILAQSFGVVPASECVLTPFNRMYVVFAAKSETGKGQSRFSSEINQIKQMLDCLCRLASKGKFAFVILDEIFTGTNPVDGETAAREFLKYFLQKNVGSHSLTMISTHYLSLADIAKQSVICANYKVDARRQNNGTILRSFKIVPGVSLLHTALDLLRTEGLLTT